MGRALRGIAFDRSLPIVPPGRGGRAIVAILVFLSFFAQCYVAQTHIHYFTADAALANSAAASWSMPAGKSVSDSVQTRDHHRPAPSDPSDCPFCQAAVHAHAVFTFSAALAPAIAYPLYFPLFNSQPPDLLYRGHDRQQRGPPSA